MTSGRWKGGIGAVLALSLAGAATCMDATDVELLQVSATGMVFGQAFLDVNGSGTSDLTDAPLEGVSVLLIAPGTRDTIVETTTDSIGVFSLGDVPLGTYELSLDSAAVLGDSLVELGAQGPVTIELGDTTLVNLGATYPVMTLEQVRAAPAGRRVFTSGIALSDRRSNGDGLVFFKGVTAYLRATNVDRTPVQPGDSVRLLGRTRLDNGQPTIDVVTPFILIGAAATVFPIDVTTSQARSANGGPLDAALVRIRAAEITDTSTVAGDFRFWAYAGTDSIEVVFRSFLTIPTAQVRPDTVVRISQANGLTGLLSPVDDGAGNIRWRMLPRNASDVSFETKLADIAVTTSYDTAQASAGDTVEIRVTARNAGPHTATSVQVSDTVPAALTYLSATATRGTYDSLTHVWSVGDLPQAAVADTLRVRVEVTGAPGTAVNRAWLRALLKEVETGSLNNSGSATLTIP